MRLLPLLALLTLAAPAWAEGGGKAASDPEMACGSEPVRQALAEQFAGRLCFNDNLKLDDLTLSLTVPEPTLTLADLLTTELSDVPLRRTCEALLSFEARIEGEALGPGPGIAYRLLAIGEPRTVTYAVGRFDDGRLYVRPTPACWKIDRLEALP